MLNRPLPWALLLAAALFTALHGRLTSLLAEALPALGPGLISSLLGNVTAVLGLLALLAWRSTWTAWLRRGWRAVERLLDATTGSLKPPWNRVAASCLLGTVLALGALVLSQATPVSAVLEGRLIDRWFALMFPPLSQAEAATRSAGERNRHAHLRPDVVLVTLDNDTIYRLGWPLPRKHYAQLLDTLHEAGAASVTFDVVLVDDSAEHPEWDQLVGAAAARAGNAVFGFPIVAESAAMAAPSAEQGRLLRDRDSLPVSQVRGEVPPLALLTGGDSRPQPVISAILPGARGSASVNVLLDGADDVLRHGTLLFRVEDRLYPSLALRTALDALGLPLSAVRGEAGGFLELGDKVRIPVDGALRTLVRYQGRFEDRTSTTFPRISFSRVLQRDVSFTLPGNPMGEDLRLVLGPEARVSVAGKPVPLDEIPAEVLRAGTRVTGRANYARDPARVLEMDFAAAPLGEPAYEVEDETHLRFDDGMKGVRVARVDGALFKGRHVLVGSTATSASDLRPMPLGAIPGVEHHATLLNNILAQDFITEVPAWSLALLCLVLAWLLAGGVALFKPIPGVLWLVGVASVLVCGVYVAFTRGLHVPLVAPAFTVGAAYLAAVILGYQQERQAKARAEESREFIRQTFGRYLTDAVVDTILETPGGLKLGGEHRTVTIVMTDLRGFTSMCTTLEPEKVVAILNNFLGTMTDVILKYGGTIDEFIGDAILIVFGAPVQRPDDAVRAVATALEMQLAMDRVNAWNVEHDLPKVYMGIGVNTGEVVVGNIGSEKRMKYAIVGTPINMCARVESFTVGGQVMLSKSTRDACGDLLQLRDEMQVTAKGLADPLTIYDVYGVKAPWNVALPVTQEDLRPVAEPIQLQYCVMAGKHGGAELFQATVVNLSDQGMEARLGQELETLSNLKFNVRGPEGLLDGDLYGKVIRPRVAEGVSYVRFTSVPPALAGFLGRARELAKSQAGASVPLPGTH